MNVLLQAMRYRSGTATALPTLLLMVAVANSAEIPMERLRELDEYVAREAANFHLPNFAVVVTSQGQIAHSKVEGKGISTDSAFLIGSCSKTITALATLISLERTNTHINTPVQDLLPDLNVIGMERPLRVVHLLQHRSGLVRSQGFDELPSLATLERDGHSIRLRHPPGERFAYCNLNYSILGWIIEALTGQSFSEFVKESVFVPAGMAASSCSIAGPADGFAPEHQYCFGVARPVPPTRVPASRIPAGFIRCSALDLARLQLALAQDGVVDGEQVFDKEIVLRMKSPPDESGFGYGMGLYRGNHRFGPIVAHEGATPTSYAFLGFLPEDDIGFVFLTNINLFDPFTDHGEAIYENMLRILKGEPVEATRPIRIWVRWLVLAVVLITAWQLMSLLLRWRERGWQFDVPTSRSDWISIAGQFVVPIVIWYVVLRWTQTPLVTVFKMEPDMMWSFAFLTASGVFTGCVKLCVPPELFKHGRPQDSNTCA